MDKKKIGAFLKLLREKKGKKQFQVAQELYEYGIEITDKTVAKWEKGNFPDLDKLAILANYYGVKPSDILNGEIYEPQNFEERYFIANDNWLSKNDAKNLYVMRVEQESLIKRRVKELFMQLINEESLTPTQNDELNFLLTHFFSVSRYAIQAYNELEELNEKERIKLLRHKIYCMILSMHNSSPDEIYWEIKKFYDYDRRITFEKDVCNFEDNISIASKRLQELEEWEKDLLLALVQTNNIANSDGKYSKLLYLQKCGRDFDEEATTKEGIKLLIESGAKLNRALLGYAEHCHFEFSILDRMKQLHNDIYDKILIAKYDVESTEYYWVENDAKNRLIGLYYALNCSREEKLTLNEIYDMFLANDNLPKEIILNLYKRFDHKQRSEKEILLMAEQMCPYEINLWNECKEREIRLEEEKKELEILEERWIRCERIDVLEYDEWVGEEKDKLTEQDVISRLSEMAYEQFIN